VAIIPVAFITINTLTQAAPGQSAQAATTPNSGSTTADVVRLPPQQLTDYHHASRNTATSTALPFDPAAANLFRLIPVALVSTVNTTTPAAPTAPVTPAPAAAPAKAAAPAGPVDTVTPYQRAEWERVAMCEEGGDWSADGGEFSGGLGISRANWDAFGGLQYAPEGAEATPDEQIMVAERIQGYPPDQHGCAGW
jgi:hypothetical protein